MKLFVHYSHPHVGVIRRTNRTATARQDIVSRCAPQHIGVRRMNSAFDVESTRMAVSNCRGDRPSLERLINRSDKPYASSGERERATPELAIITSSSGFGFCGDAAEQCGGLTCVCLCFHYINKITQRSVARQSIFTKKNAEENSTTASA